MDDRVGTSLHTGLLIAVIGIFAWTTGLPALFPSLGPSAFVLAMFPESKTSNPRRVIGGHAIGVVAGLLAYHAFAPGLVVTRSVEPLSLVSLRFTASSVAAIVVTVGGMLFSRMRHPPACATTLIVSLGLLSSLFEGTLIVLTVVVLVAVQWLLVSRTELLSGLQAIVTDWT